MLVDLFGGCIYDGNLTIFLPMRLDSKQVQFCLTSGYSRYAKVPSQLLLLDGLFRPSWRGSVSGELPFSLEYAPSSRHEANRDQWVFSGPSSLSMLDFEVLLAALYLMGLPSHRTTLDPGWLKRTLSLSEPEHCIGPNAFGMWFHWSEMAHVMGLVPSTMAIRRIRASLERLVRQPWRSRRLLLAMGRVSKGTQRRFCTFFTPRTIPNAGTRPLLGIRPWGGVLEHGVRWMSKVVRTWRENPASPTWIWWSIARFNRRRLSACTPG